jgi:hypothetical protein
MSAVILRQETDVAISGSGTIYLFHLLTEAARDWVDGHVSEDRQVFGTALAVEHRYVADLAQGMRADGLGVTVEAF